MLSLESLWLGLVLQSLSELIQHFAKSPHKLLNHCLVIHGPFLLTRDSVRAQVRGTPEYQITGSLRKGSVLWAREQTEQHSAHVQYM